MPLAVAFLLFSLMEFSKKTGIGPGLAFLMLGMYIFPATALLSIAMAGKGNRLAASAGVVLVAIAVVLIQILVHPNFESVVVYWYLSTLLATVFGTLIGRIVNRRQSIFRAL